jgi:energy-coupling factor transport system permease protein
LWIVALVVGVSNIVFGASNPDPAATELLRLGPLRITEPAVAIGFALGLRVVAIASVGAVFALTTDATRLVDALVQQAGVSERFAYGALAAYQAVPHFAQDLATLRQARRIRGLRATWHPSVVLGLLVLAIRHGDRLALAMDARAFGSGPMTHYREVRWSSLDAAVSLGAAIVLMGALAVGVAR